MNPKVKRAVGVAATAAAVGAVATLVQRKRSAQKAEHALPPEHISSQLAHFEEVVPGVSKCMLWGHPNHGPYGAFTRFAPGHQNSLHYHSHDIRLVVLEGAYLYRVDGREQRVAAGDYFLVPGGAAHVSAADPTQGCLFFEESAAEFDMIPL